MGVRRRRASLEEVALEGVEGTVGARVGVRAEVVGLGDERHARAGPGDAPALGERRDGVISPDVRAYTPSGDTIYRLVAENPAGRRERELTVFVRRDGEP